jgi:RNA polymerase sigma factor (sigma-70 family)
MSSQEVGPEWILSTFALPGPGVQGHINEVTTSARRLWPRIQAHALKEQPGIFRDEAIAIASDVWETTLQSVGKTIVRSNGRGIQIRDLDAYLFGIFIHRFNRALRKERKRRQMFQYFASTRELELLRQAHDSRAARDIEQSVQAKEAVRDLDEWPRKVWIARKYGYSFPEIASFLGMSEAQVKLRFRYALARLREKLGL